MKTSRAPGHCLLSFPCLLLYTTLLLLECTTCPPPVAFDRPPGSLARALSFANWELCCNTDISGLLDHRRGAYGHIGVIGVIGVQEGVPAAHR